MWKSAQILCYEAPPEPTLERTIDTCVGKRFEALDLVEGGSAGTDQHPDLGVIYIPEDGVSCHS